MLKAEGLQVKGELLSGWKGVSNLPLLRQIKELPLTTAFGTAMIMSIHLSPTLMFLRRIPDDLRIRAHQEIASPAFQLLTCGTVNDFVIFPVICYEHIFKTFLFLIYNINNYICFAPSAQDSTKNSENLCILYTFFVLFRFLLHIFTNISLLFVASAHIT